MGFAHGLASEVLFLGLGSNQQSEGYCRAWSCTNRLNALSGFVF